MKTGWFKVGPHWYYAYGSGALAVSTTTPDGYRVNGNGEWVNQAQAIGKAFILLSKKNER